jgi:UDP-glucuronate decarboxylase
MNEPSNNILTTADREMAEWSELNGESIFITGGTGFFGTSLLYSLLRVRKTQPLDIKITLLTRNISVFSKKHPLLFTSDFIDCLEGDIRNFAFPEKKYSKIFHLATTSATETFNGEDQLNKYKLLVDGTERLMQFAGKCGVKKVLFTSSGIVYGELLDGITSVDESYSGAPSTIVANSALAHGKRSAEFLISYYADKYNFDYVIARCFSFVGPDLPLDIHYAVGNFIFDALYKDVIEVKGDGLAVRSYLDTNDLIVWLLRLMSRKCDHNIYNVGSDQQISISKLAHLISEVISPNKKIKICGDSNHSIGNFNRDYYVPNIDRIRLEHKVNIWTDLRESIGKFSNEK